MGGGAGQCSVGKLDPVPIEIQHVCNCNVDPVKSDLTKLLCLSWLSLHNKNKRKKITQYGPNTRTFFSITLCIE